jgi:uncharacterized membrane protein YoaK (UPF0700 family)
LQRRIIGQPMAAAPNKRLVLVAMIFAVAMTFIDQRSSRSRFPSVMLVAFLVALVAVPAGRPPSSSAHHPPA